MPLIIALTTDNLEASPRVNTTTFENLKKFLIILFQNKAKQTKQTQSFLIATVVPKLDNALVAPNIDITANNLQKEPEFFQPLWFFFLKKNTQFIFNKKLNQKKRVFLK